MSRSLELLKTWLGKHLRWASTDRTERSPSPPSSSFDPDFEPLETRLMPAVTGIFTADAGTLAVFGDDLDNNIVVSRNAAGSILINGGSNATVRGNDLLGGGPICIVDASEPLVEDNTLTDGPHIFGHPGDGAAGGLHQSPFLAAALPSR